MSSVIPPARSICVKDTAEGELLRRTAPILNSEWLPSWIKDCFLLIFVEKMHLTLQPLPSFLPCEMSPLVVSCVYRRALWLGGADEALIYGNHRTCSGSGNVFPQICIDKYESVLKTKKVEIKVHFLGAFKYHGSQPNFTTQTVKHPLRCSISFKQATPPGIWPQVRWKSGNCFLFRVNFRFEPLAWFSRTTSIFWSVPRPPPRFRWLASDCSLRSHSAPSVSEQLELRHNRSL